ncbi:caspase-7-like [Ornithodoros turicata]|uniref:caspase-7-like n=1 Tax=Ornithodoros turicata TaxID=34597 RepID=UPI00313A3C4B
MASTSEIQADAQPSVPDSYDPGVECWEPFEREYRMDRKNQGFCLIINVLRFSIASCLQLEDRREDLFNRKAKTIKNTFEAMGFKCEDVECRTWEEMKEKLNEYKDKKQELRDSNCFVCWLLTCRTEDNKVVQLHAHNRPMQVNDIVDPFIGKNCEELVGKPKLFFIEADLAEKKKESTLADDRSPSDKAPHKIPNTADVLVATCMIGKGDMRYTETVCDVFGEHITKEPVNEIAVLLAEVANRIGSSKSNSATTSPTQSTLTKHLYLTKMDRLTDETPKEPSVRT